MKREKKTSWKRRISNRQNILYGLSQEVFGNARVRRDDIISAIVIHDERRIAVIDAIGRHILLYNEAYHDRARELARKYNVRTGEVLEFKEIE